MAERFRNVPMTGALVARMSGSTGRTVRYLVCAAFVFAAMAGCEKAPDSSAPDTTSVEGTVGPAVEHLRRGWELFDKEDYDGAIAAYTKAIELDADLAEAYRGRAVAHSRECAEDNVIADYTEVIRLKPDDAEAYLRRAIAHENKGNYDEAIVDCTKAIEIDPGYAEAWYRRAISLGFRNEYDEKIRQLRKAIELDPDGKIGQDARNSLGVMDVERRKQGLPLPREPSPGTGK